MLKIKTFKNIFKNIKILKTEFNYQQQYNSYNNLNSNFKKYFKHLPNAALL